MVEQDDILTVENNVENQRNSIVQEDNRDTSFAMEQNSIPCLRKCFEHATNVDYHQTKNGRWQFYIKMGYYSDIMHHQFVP